MRRSAWALAAAAALTGCTADAGGPPGAAPGGPASPSSSSSPTSAAPVADTATLECDHSIGGGPPPPEYQVVLGVVALPAGPGSPALQAGPGGNGPGFPPLFAKTGLLVKAGAAFELEAVAQPGNRTALGWGSWSQEAPTQRFVVPGCPGDDGTGWLAYAGGYYADRPLCLPLIVRTGGQEQRVSVGVGAACPGQQPPPAP